MSIIEEKWDKKYVFVEREIKREIPQEIKREILQEMKQEILQEIKKRNTEGN